MVSKAAIPATAAAILAIAGLPEAMAQIAPHRAAYTLEMADTGSRRLSGAEGRMLFLWDRSCEGWVTEQHITVTLAGPEGDLLETESHYETFETLAGDRMTFRSEFVLNGETDEIAEGEAEMGADGGTVRYSQPRQGEADLPAEAIFPSFHTLELMERAAAGERFFTALVFDGSDATGLSEVTAVISGELEPWAEDDNPLLRHPGWRVALAFFDASQQGAEPTSEITIDLLENGVVRAMEINYGDFVLEGTLSALEELERVEC
ncbi:MAG: DUF1849 family protein [Azospirillaceae bacterium]